MSKKMEKKLARLGGGIDALSAVIAGGKPAGMRAILEDQRKDLLLVQRLRKMKPST